MNLETTIPALLNAAALVLVAVIETRNHRMARRSEKRAARRTEENMLAMEMMLANCKLSTVTAKAVTGHKTNGDVEEALVAAKEAREAYEDFKKRLSAEQVTKI